MAYPRTVTTTTGHAAAIRAGLEATYSRDYQAEATTKLVDMFLEMSQALGIKALDVPGKLQRDKLERYSATLSDLANEIHDAMAPVGR